MSFRKFLGLEYYVSKLDQFLALLSKKYPKPSASQHQEIEKYRRVFALRDGKKLPANNKDFWENF